MNVITIIVKWVNTDHVKKMIKAIAPLLLVACAISSADAQQVMANFTKNPPLSEYANRIPMVMLTLSSDHQLFIKAYNDYDDVNGDGGPDTTYKPSIKYIGYFDSKKCYTYSSELYSIGGDADANYYCSSNMWSGNFLNWVSMTRVDIVRLVLYGGYRSTDLIAQTVLERSFLPQDAHSFAKYYSGSDINKLVDLPSITKTCSSSTAGKCDGYTFCNTSKPTSSTALSQLIVPTNSPPLLRVVQGNFSLWASSERFQCLASGASPDEFLDVASSNSNVGKNRPTSDTRLGKPIWARPPQISEVTSFVVRVEACGTNSSNGDHNCKMYLTNKKPIGLLQENMNVQFGLITKGYNTNKQYGVLRKNVSSFSNELDANGKFIARPINAGLYATPPAATTESIIGSLNALRIVDYSYGHPSNDDNWKGTYFVTAPAVNNGNFDYTGADDCRWGITSFNNGKCRNWGNPFSEIMTESYRYFSGAAAASVVANDVNLVPGLSVAAWSPPVLDTTKDWSCVNMNVLGFNASAVSYDGDVLNTATPSSLGIGGSTATVASMTRAIGTTEIDASSKYFVGKSIQGAEANEGYCTAKTIANLDEVRGTCPDAPRLEGSYLIAGLARHVYTNDVLPSVAGTNTIGTFGVNLSGALPQIKAKVPGQANRYLTIVPACRNAAIGGNCAIVDFKEFSRDESNASTHTGEYFVSFENSEQGGDYDQDINGIIKYTVTGTTITIDTKIVSVSGPDSMVFGFVLSGSGTDADTYYGMSTAINNVISDACGSGASGCVATTGGWQTKVVTLGANAGDIAAGKFLKSPLYYASRWGSFSKGASGTNTSPAANEQTGFAEVTSPNQLRENLYNVLTGFVNKTATGTAAGVTTGTLTGEGLMMHSVYHPMYEGTDKAEVSWVGRFNALFIDAKGRLREDVAPLGELTSADPVANIFYDETSKKTLFYRYTLDSADNVEVNQDALTLDNLKPVWSARDSLAGISDADVVIQRPYTDTSNKRYIFTGVDQAVANILDGVVNKNETIAFQSSSVAVAPYNLVKLMDVADATAAQNMINYIRGLDSNAYRNRSANWGTGSKTWRLGDIVGSTPAIVGRPKDNYDSAYGDETYSEFRDKYKNRRQMVYVGANDGMLHAFNSGFPVVKKYENHTSLAYATTPPIGTADAHPLGKEMWAYVPYNLLPHLKWLADKNYSHVNYVDSDVQSFDVNIFGGEDQNIYPGGWGTIIVVGMHFGGGDYTVTGVNNTVQTLRSAYIIMDVTNPEAAPKLLAEITDADLGYTAANVTVVKQRARNTSGSYTNPAKNKWYMVFGSGPQGADGLSKALSDTEARLFYLNLKSLTDSTPTAVVGKALAVPTGTLSFIGGISAKDWDNDYQDDMVYFGIVGDRITPASAPLKGRLEHANINFTGGNLIVDMGATSGGAPIRYLLTGSDTLLPFSYAPLAVRDRSNNYWLFVGTGRFYVKEDFLLTDANTFFGLKLNNPNYTAANAATEKPWLSTTTYQPLASSKLRDVTNDTISVNAAGDIEIDMSSGAQNQTMAQYKAAIASSTKKMGWLIRLSGTGESNSYPPIFRGTSVAFTSYIPGVNLCEQRGNAELYVLDMFTGLAATNLENLRWSGDGLAPTGTTTKEVLPKTTIDDGPVFLPPDASTPRIPYEKADGVVGTVNLETKRGIPVRQSWRQIILE